MIGKTLSHYRVIEKIGQGGMGEVYRAEDTNLSREVAIKVLPEQFTKDPQRLARFEREAKLLASLNHPNIAAIYGFEEADDVRFLALELVLGETLAEKVAKGPVPVEEVLEVCRQIAEGVEAAHEKGVIHRDLKPANVKVTPEGKVKILDFGLAKAFEDEIPAADISQSPTLTEEMTRAGVILGTAAYMSPEQAKGEAVDKRADIFAFGCVLYELLTGKRTFDGKTITETLAKILEGEPNWAALPDTTPLRIKELLQDCLQKEVRNRVHDVSQLRIQIKKAIEEPAAELPIGVASAAQPGGQPWGMIVGLVVLALAVGGMVTWLLVQPSAPEQRLNKFVTTPSTAPLRAGGSNELAISPDGRHFVYAITGESGNQLYLRSLDDFVDRPIPGTEGVVGSPFFSPDGESVGFFTAGSLRKISLSGGSPITLCEAGPPSLSGSWGLDDTIVFTAAAEGAPGLYRVPAAGGEREFLGSGTPGTGEDGYGSPHLLPDGKGVLLSLSLPPVDYRTEVLSLDTGERKIILGNSRAAMYVDTGHLIYEQAGTGNLMAASFDLTRLEVTGDPVLVLQGVRENVPGRVDYAVSDNGTLVYVPGDSSTSHEHSLVWVDREGNETSVTDEKRDYRTPRVSPDGRQISSAVGDPGTDNQIWIYDLEAESLNRLTFEEDRSGSAAWSPDSKWLVFQSGRPGEGGLVRKPADGSLPQERLTSTPVRQMPTSWSSDGRFLAFIASTGSATAPDIGILSLEEEKEPEYIIATPAMECCAKFSPDGKWLAYISDESGRLQVYVRPFQGPDVKWLISKEDEGGAQPVWSPDGKELFYRIGDRTMVVSIQTEDQTVRAGNARLLFEGRYVSHSYPPGLQYYDVSPDGRFLMLKEDTAQQQGRINVVLNWFEELKRLVPTP